MRKVLVLVEVDDDRAIQEDMGTIEYIEREFGWLEQSGIYLNEARILDDDDEYDAEAIELTAKIFNEDN